MNHFDMELTQRQTKEYRKATKKQKGEIITRYCQLTGASRNLASKRFMIVARDIHPRILNTKRKISKIRRGRKPRYISFHKGIIKKVWKLSGEICAERLHPVVVEYIDQLEKEKKLKYYGKRYITESKEISEATLKRIIQAFPRTHTNRSNKGNANIYKQIPIQAYFGKNANKSGYIEIDYVEHNGGNSSGCFGITGTYVDVCLGWIAREAGLGKGMHAVKRIHETNEKKIYHRVHEYHPDNAKPILKLLLEKTMGTKPTNYHISRSRPYHKEDNGHVEQKNNDKVRKLVGYHRYDTDKQIAILNKLYAIEDQISNYYLPSQKLIGKEKDARGKVIAKKYDIAKTAYKRLMKAKDISDKVKKTVKEHYNNTNLVQLRKESYMLQSRLLQTVISRKRL